MEVRQEWLQAMAPSVGARGGSMTLARAGFTRMAGREFGDNLNNVEARATVMDANCRVAQPETGKHRRIVADHRSPRQHGRKGTL